MIKGLRSVRDNELTRRNTEFDQLQRMLISYVFACHRRVCDSSVCVCVFVFLSRTKDNRVDDIIDLYVQIVLRQGQVEIEPKPADVSPSEYRNTEVELIHRREIEDLNELIIVSGGVAAGRRASLSLSGIGQLQNSANGENERRGQRHHIDVMVRP